MKNRSEFIDSIIKQRQPLVKKIADIEEKLKFLAHILRTIDERRHQLQQQIKESDISDRLSTIDFSSLELKINAQLVLLSQLRQRFSRDTLNIGVVGLIGQGKSTFLQNISGLTNTVIPALKGEACTAVRSTICHEPQATYAEVTFHSEQTFLDEVISPYYKALNLGTPPKTLDDFAKPLPSFAGTDATQKSMYERFKEDYHLNLEEYRKLFRSGSPRRIPRIPKERIHQYVCQRRFPQGDLITFDHLAVRDVQIVCPYKNVAVGRLVLVDTPGLGEIRPAQDEFRRLGQEVDVIIFIRKPDRFQHEWEKRDTDLYATATKALNNIENRSFMILNHVTGNDDNLEACQKYQTTIREQQINVVRCAIADCSNPKQANTCIDLVLNYLANNITYLDAQHARSYQKQVNQLQITINAELEKARQAWSGGLIANDIKDMKKFLPLFNKLWASLNWGLEELLVTLDRGKNHPESTIVKQQVELIIQTCKKDTGIPTDNAINKIIELRFIEGDWQSTYAKYLHEIRDRLTQNLHALDKGLKQYIDLVKSQVTDVLVKEGNLAGLSEVRGVEFLNVMVELVPDRLKRLKAAFQTLSNFEMSYQVHFHYRLRPHLNNLNPHKTNLQLSQSIPAESKELKAKEILNYLEVLQEEAVFKCQQALEDFYGEPAQAAFAEVEQFVDRVVRAKEIENEWAAFLFQEKAKVWPFEFGQDREGDERQQWLQLVDRAVAANQLKELQFLR
ncbi:MAG TPA: hypothetical protein DDZ80_08530 [Cyanobacteria bacterium UBA8803]|nr:hypothetical protein [Cyanobacteria bacterium UBA9273]HBL58546.1 hypothetical protein [Cyanobacteria bacterium UBA8803]